jgi:hypothetical protein
MLADLEAAEQAYERGDFAATRRLARAVMVGTATEEEKARARDLLGRIARDRLFIALLAACVLFFLVTVLGYTGRL